MDISPQPQGVGFTPISLTGDTDPVTGACTVNFTASLDDQSEPNLVLSFYEVKRSNANRSNAVVNGHTDPDPDPDPDPGNNVAFLIIDVPVPPTPIWDNGFATFALAMNTAIFNQLSSLQTNFAVEAQISGNSNSMGMCIFAISL